VPPFSLALPGLALAPFPLEVSAGDRPDLLGINIIEEVEGGLELELEYRAGPFGSDLPGQFKALLQRLVTNPANPLSALPVLTEAEERQLEHWNSTQVEYPEKRLVHQLFEAQVAREPHAPAVIFENQVLSYAELNRRANQLAHTLRGLTIDSETLVGVCLERSVEMVVALMGIVKAGAAYVPLDPTYPPERLAYMLQDSQVPVVLNPAAPGEPFTRLCRATHLPG